MSHELLKAKSDTEFAELMRRVAGGDQEASRALFDRYGGHILRVVRRRLNGGLRVRYDSSDFMQDVWKSFFVTEARRRVFSDPAHLVRFLANMACHKVADGYRRQTAGRRHAARPEHSFDSVAAHPPAKDPTPSRCASAKEELDRLMRNRPTIDRQVAALLGEGDSHTEVAKKLDINVRTVRRIIRRLATRA
jgi:RNA polymerase sigma factor (sigma-70 family)